MTNVLRHTCLVLLAGCAAGPSLDGGAYLASGEAMLPTSSTPQLRTEALGVFVDGSGTPTHLFDLRWNELHEVEFTDGANLSEDVCSEPRCDWFVERDTGCVQIAYDEFFRTGRYDDTGYAWSGSMEVCPGEEPYPHELAVRTGRGTPWLIPGDALVIEANYPLEPDMDVFEVRIDGATAPVSPTVMADDAHWRMEVPPALSSLDVEMVGPRVLTPTRVPSAIPTTAVIEDWTLASAPPEGSHAGLPMSYSSGALSGSTGAPAFYPVHALFALGPVEGARLNADLTLTEGQFSYYTHVYTARADGTLGPIVEELGQPIPVAEGSGDVWLVFSHDPLGHPTAAPVGLRFGGVTVE